MISATRFVLFYSLMNNLIINRQIGDIDIAYCTHNMDDWKLKARVVVKLKREANMLVSSCIIELLQIIRYYMRKFLPKGS